MVVQALSLFWGDCMVKAGNGWAPTPHLSHLYLIPTALCLQPLAQFPRLSCLPPRHPSMSGLAETPPRFGTQSPIQTESSLSHLLLPLCPLSPPGSHLPCPKAISEHVSLA